MLKKCEKIVDDGIILDVIRFHLEKIDEKLWFIFVILKSENKEAITALTSTIEQKEVSQSEINLFINECVKTFWDTLYYLEEFHSNSIKKEIIALEYLLINNDIFKRYFDETFAQKIKEKCESFLREI